MKEEYLQRLLLLDPGIEKVATEILGPESVLIKNKENGSGWLFKYQSNETSFGS